MARLVKIKGTATATANDSLIADSNSKIPAVDASLITTLSGGNIASGTIPTAQLDVGTTANKLVQLDGSGKLPAIDGSQLTNISTSTKSSSNPTIATNPSGGVGTEWHNTSTGNMYICTDATAGANVWKNVGVGSGHVGAYKFQGDTYGWRIGGGPSATQIDRYPFATQTNATDVGDCITYAGIGCQGGAKSKTHGFKVGGDSGGKTPIDKFAFTSGGSVSVTDHGDLATGVYGGATAGNGDYIWKAGGYASGGLIDDIEKFATATDSNATKTGDLNTGVVYLAGGQSSETNGYMAGGHTGNYGPSSSPIRKWSFASDGNSTSTASLYQNQSYTSSNCSTTHGYAHGGYPSINVIQKFTFAADTNATDVGDLTVAGDYCIGSSSTTYGYCAGNRNSPQNVIERYSFSADGNSTDWADLDHNNNGGGNSAAS